MHPQSARSYRDRIRKTFPLRSLGAPATPITLPGVGDARSSPQLPQHNLGRGSCRVGKSSIGSLQEASLQAQELAESFPFSFGIAPASRMRRSLSESNPLRHFAFEEGTRHKLQQEQVPPPTQLWEAVSQLRAEIMTLQKMVRKLAELTLGELPPTLGAELADACAQHSDNNNNNTNDDNNNTNNTNNNLTNNNNNNNDNDNNKNSRESGWNSLDLDNDNPESEPDLDETNLVSFNPAMGDESSSGSLDQQEADLSFEKLRPPNDDNRV